MGPSDAHFGPPQPRTVEGQRPPRLRGPPVLRRVLSLRAVPTTPASHPEPGGCPGPGYSGLPRVRVGSALATALSGPAQGSLAFGPQICWPSFRGLLSGRLDVLQLPEDRPPVATRLNRQLPRQDSHLQERATFARRTPTVWRSRSWASPLPASRGCSSPESLKSGFPCSLVFYWAAARSPATTYGGERRANRWMGMSIGRLRPGSTVEQARAELLAISDQLTEEDPIARGPRSVTVDALPSYQLPNGSEAQIRGFVWLLLGVTGFTLLLACANLANLLLARASARKREIGVRLAIGAGRGRLLRQLMTESVVLAVAGAGLGVFVADTFLRLLGNFQLPGSVTIASLGIGLDGRLLVMALAISLVTSVLFGLVPALQATHPDLVHALKGDSIRDGTSRSNRLRQGLIAVQVATCVVLLVGSSLFLRTLRQGLNVDLGIETDGVALARFSLNLLQYEPSDAITFANELRARANRLPGVDATSVSTRVPLQQGGAMGFFAEVEGYELAPDEELRVDLVFTSTGYFESLGIPNSPRPRLRQR